MAKVEHQGGTSKPLGLSAIDVQEELGLGVRKEDKGMKQEHVADLEYMCEHYTSRTTELTEILDRIKLFSWGAECEICGLGELDGPQKKREDVMPDLIVLWACLDCEQIFCGNERPDIILDGHLADHSLETDHPLWVRLDKMSEIWCLLCSVKEEVESATDFWDEREDDNSCIVKKLPNYGNTCYFNSLLQNLFAMDKLRGCLARLEQPVRDITREMKCLFTEACDESKDTIQPTCLLGLVRQNKPFVCGTQQDSHELFIFLLDELKSENVDFVDKIFGGESSSSVHCAQCGRTSTMKEPFLDLSLAVPSTSHLIRRGVNIGPKDNVPPARKGDKYEHKGTVGKSFLDDLLALDYSNLVPKLYKSFFSDDPFGMRDILTPVPLSYMEPGSEEPVPISMENIPEVASENVEAVFPDHSDVENTIAKLPEHLFEKGEVSSSGKPDAKLEKDVKDINTVVEAGKWSGDSSNASMFDAVYEVDNVHGLVSIERCLDIYTQVEELSDMSCDGCSVKLQQQQPSETSDFRKDADKPSENSALELPSNKTYQKKDECAENNLADGIGSSQTQTETDQLNMNEDLEIKCKQVESKITKKFFINYPPPILTIHMKRFTKTFQKVEGYIDFKELLDLAPYIRRSSAENKQHIYRLIGVVEHLGSTLCNGHYVAYVKREKRPGCKAWFKANDTQVEEIKLGEVLKRDGYIFFYERLEN